MKSNALQLGASAIIGVRIYVSELSRVSRRGILVVAVYGTAIKKHINGGTKKYRKLKRSKTHRKI